jgi:hypothetical protein
MRTPPILVAFALAACAADTDDAVDPDKGDQICRDARYGDGVCQMGLDCHVPDIDCFLTFDSDRDGASWFAGIERQIAAGAGQQPRTLLPESDPRFRNLRGLLDRGWAAYSSVMPVGRGLQVERPALVLVDDPEPNAFVTVDAPSQRAGLAIMVQTGLLEQGIDEAGLLGMFMHELSHAVRLHGIAGNDERMRTFYVATPGEPIGAFTPDDPRARAAGEPWRMAGVDAGPYSDGALGGFPFGGKLEEMLRYVEGAGANLNPIGCGPALADVAQLRADLAASRDPLGGELQIDRTFLPQRIAGVLGELRDGCLGFYTKGFVQVVAEKTGAAPADIMARMSIADQALVANRHVVDAIAALVADRRAFMRDLEASFTATTNQPWQRLRFFSYEEDADDSSEPALRALGLVPWGLAGTFDTLIGPALSARCSEARESGGAPYGVDLVDEHHATCWRIGHLIAMGNATAPRRAPLPGLRIETGSTLAALPLGHSVADDIMY